MYHSLCNFNFHWVPAMSSEGIYPSIQACCGMTEFTLSLCLLVGVFFLSHMFVECLIWGPRNTTANGTAVTLPVKLSLKFWDIIGGSKLSVWCNSKSQPEELWAEQSLEFNMAHIIQGMWAYTFILSISCCSSVKCENIVVFATIYIFFHNISKITLKILSLLRDISFLVSIKPATSKIPVKCWMQVIM